jgi:membrane protease YdiL (CAAX protease family)
MSPAARELIYLPGVFAPAIVALVMTARARGRAGLRALLDGLRRWKVNVGWYTFAVVYLAAAKLLAATAHRVVCGIWPLFGIEPWYVLLVAVLFSTPSQAGEEIGWRGYALPRLASRMGLAAASVVLGVVWAAWHLPFFYLAGTEKSGRAFLPYLLSTTAFSVAMAALFWRTRGSLLLTMLMHAAINNTKDIVPSTAARPGEPLLWGSTPIAWLTIAVLWAGALGLLVWMARDARARTGAGDSPPLRL